MQAVCARVCCHAIALFPLLKTAVLSGISYLGILILGVVGGDEDEIVFVTVTGEVLTLFAEDEDGKPIDGVNCRLVVDIVLEVDDEGEFEAVEVTDDYYAQATNGDVHYCGEVARNYE